MLGDSRAEWIFIRLAIPLVQYTGPIAAGLLGITKLFLRPAGRLATALTSTLLAIVGAEALFYFLIHRPHVRRLEQKYPPRRTTGTAAGRAAPAPSPSLPSPAERKALFAKVLAHTPHVERYLRVWFLGAADDDIRRDNLIEFLQWSFLDRDVDREDVWTGLEPEEKAEITAYVDAIERRLGRRLEPGRGPARALRLTIDDVATRYRGAAWYAVIWVVDAITGSMLGSAGFRYYGLAPPAPRANPPGKTCSPQESVAWPSAFPPRPHGLFTPPWARKPRTSPSSELTYWLRPHTSTDPNVLPVVFLHGVGVGLWPYLALIRSIATGVSSPSSPVDSESIGILAIEVLAVSNRIAAPPPVDAGSFARHLALVLSSLGPRWTRFVLVGHSYGTALATQVLRHDSLGRRASAVVLVDPVSILLHLPDVAYNFTRRAPTTANEWQLWYFASTDVGVAMALGRHFPWMECIVWAEELLGMAGKSGKAVGEEEEEEEERDAVRLDDFDGASAGQNGSPSLGLWGYAPGARRRAAVCLAEKDIIVDTATVLDYLEGRMPVDGRDSDRGACFTDLGGRVLWCRGLDHAGVLDDKVHRDALAQLIREFCIQP